MEKIKMIEEIFNERYSGFFKEDCDYENNFYCHRELEIHTDNYQVEMKIEFFEGNWYNEKESVDVFDKEGEPIEISKEEREELLKIINQY